MEELSESEEELHSRIVYLEELKKYKDVPLVKILCGIRRCGKSSLLALYKKHLLEAGVKAEQIVSISYSDMEFAGITNASEMYDDILSRMSGQKKCYLLLDEVQDVDGWEKTVNSLFENKNADIYVTGSNSKLLASEISTYLSGRYVMIHVLPLSFKEFLQFKKIPEQGDVGQAFGEFIRCGGFPLVARSNFDERTCLQVVEGIYFSVVEHDIAGRYEISNKELFDRIVRFVFENVGKNFSANSIVKFLKSQHRSTNVELVYNYLDYLQQAFIIYKCSRYDIQGKNVLKTLEKYYLADSALKYCLLGYNPASVASMLENVVYLELVRRGYSVFTGKDASREIDFVAVKNEMRLYIQVCRMLPENSEREIGNLRAIKDSYPKYALTTNRLDTGIVDGIRILLITDWLLEK